MLKCTVSSGLIEKKEHGKNNYNAVLDWISHLSMYYIQHVFLCRPSYAIVLEDAGTEPWTVAILVSATGRSNHSAHPQELLHNFL
jgi:hypothetical protein